MNTPVSWIRLEPTAADGDLVEGLSATIADPLWLISRQIGFGELSALDGGSPKTVSATAITSRLSRLRPHTATGSPADPITLPAGCPAPLEALIEAEPDPQPLPEDPGNAFPEPVPAALAGLHYLRLLRASKLAADTYLAGLVKTFPLIPSPAGAEQASPQAAQPFDPLVRLFAGKVPNGQTLYSNLAAPRDDPTTTPEGHPEPPGGFTDIAPIAAAWLAWYDQTCGSPNGLQLSTAPTWQPARLEYGVDLVAPGPAAETVLRAAEHAAGRLDWYHFDILASSVRKPTDNDTLGASADDPAAAPDVTRCWTAIPTPASYPGAPNRRWWAFEDAAVNFGNISVPREGSVTALVIDYALRYGNDHYLLPLPLDLGTLARIQIVVTTTFGDRILIKPVAELEPAGAFRLFELSGPDPGNPGPRDPLLVLFPTIPELLAGRPIETVAYSRDELAETVWAVEQIALGPAGIPVDRGTISPESNDSGPTNSNTRTYALHTDLPANYYAFVLPDPASQPTVMPFAAITDTEPWGRILAPQTSTGLPQEEVTRAGLTVSRTWRYARWIDGSALAWVGRAVDPGSGEIISGFQFDVAQ